MFEKPYHIDLIQDYFWRLRLTHFAAETELPAAVGLLAGCFFPNPKNKRKFQPSYLAEFHAGRDTSFSNFIGDIARRGDTSPTETRSKIAKAGGELKVVFDLLEDVHQSALKDVSLDKITGLNDRLIIAFATGERLEPDSNLSPRREIAAIALASYMHKSLNIGDTDRSERFLNWLGKYAEQTEQKLQLDPADRDRSLKVASDMGEALGQTFLSMAILIDPVLEVAPRSDTFYAASSLGKQALLHEYGAGFKQLRLAYKEGLQSTMNRRQKNIFRAASFWMGMHFGISRIRQKF